MNTLERYDESDRFIVSTKLMTTSNFLKEGLKHLTKKQRENLEQMADLIEAINLNSPKYEEEKISPDIISLATNIRPYFLDRIIRERKYEPLGHEKYLEKILQTLKGTLEPTKDMIEFIENLSQDLLKSAQKFCYA